MVSVLVLVFYLLGRSICFIFPSKLCWKFDGWLKQYYGCNGKKWELLMDTCDGHLGLTNLGKLTFPFAFRSFKLSLASFHSAIYFHPYFVRCSGCRRCIAMGMHRIYQCQLCHSAFFTFTRCFLGLNYRKMEEQRPKEQKPKASENKPIMTE